MKKIVTLIMMCVLLLCVFTACAQPEFVKFISYSDYEQTLYKKSNDFGSYDITYKMKQEIILYDLEDSRNPEISRDYVIAESTMKKKKSGGNTGDFDRYQFTGNFERKQSDTTEKFSFQLYNEKNATTIFFKNGLRENYTGSSIDSYQNSQIDRLPSSCSLESNILQIEQWKIGDTFDYVLVHEKSNSTNNTQSGIGYSIFRSVSPTINVPNISSTPNAVSAKSEVFVDNRGYIMRQILYVEMSFANGSMPDTGKKVKGTGILTIESVVHNPGRDVNIG